MTWEQIWDGIQHMVEATGEGIGVITDNPGLMAIFGASILAVGFKLFKRAKRTAR